jgi:hypothetical protein
MAPRFLGWLKQGPNRWRPVCSADSEAQCWRELLALPRVGNTDMVVLPAGEHPQRSLGPPGPRVSADARR